MLLSPQATHHAGRWLQRRQTTSWWGRQSMRHNLLDTQSILGTWLVTSALLLCKNSNTTFTAYLLVLQCLICSPGNISSARLKKKRNRSIFAYFTFSNSFSNKIRDRCFTYIFHTHWILYFGRLGKWVKAPTLTLSPAGVGMVDCGRSINGCFLPWCIHA